MDESRGQPRVWMRPSTVLTRQAAFLRCVQGECLQQLADSSLEVCAAQPDEALTPAMEADTRASARALYAQSVDAYKQVLTALPHAPSLAPSR